MDIIFRPYQIKDIAYMTQTRRVINGNEPGLGKTLETLTTMKNLEVGKTLIISPKIATGVWKFEMKQWYGWQGMSITGDFTKVQRNQMRREFEESNTQFMMINFALLKETQEWQSTWNTIVVDEAHLGGLLNARSITFQLMQKFKCENLFLLTGTPVRKGPQDLWPMLNLLQPKKFPSYWGFVHRYCVVMDNGFGKDILNRPKEPLRFKAMLDCHMIRNLKKNVLPELPDKQRQVVPLDMRGKQLKAYNELLNDMILELEDDIIVTPNQMTQALRLRQIAVCPRILGIDDDGVLLRALAEELIPEEFDAGRAVAVATPFKQAVPFIVAAIKKKTPDVQIELIHGGLKEGASEVAQRFQQIRGHKKVLIYTIKSGASWTAHTASTGFMLGYEWSTNDNLQAEDRIHRIGQKLDVYWKYLLLNGTIDEAVMTKLDEKTLAANWILKPEEVYAKLQEVRNRYVKSK